MWSTSKLVSLLLVALGSVVEGAPALLQDRDSTAWSSGLTNGQCVNPIVRVEWRSMNIFEKSAYLAAVQCLYFKPSKSGYPGVRNRYDDFNGAHIAKSIGFFQGTGGIHFVGQFLPWHRYFVAAYEKALREECYYPFGQPYWDWTLDAGNFIKSPVFDPLTGFGGNGQAMTVNVSALPISSPYLPGGTGGGCLQTGWFQNWTVNVGPYDNLDYNPHCLARDFHPALAASYMTAPLVASAIAQNTVDAFQYHVEGTPNPTLMTFHGAGHFSVGGSAGDIYSSSSEPLFFLHHAQIDRIWTLYQAGNPSRLTEINGPILPFTTGPNVTLNTAIDLDAVAPSLEIKQLMNTQAGVLCYEYQ